MNGVADEVLKNLHKARGVNRDLRKGIVSYRCARAQTLMQIFSSCFKFGLRVDGFAGRFSRAETRA